jgi:rhodanese-related sulfurtransferase
VLQVGSRIFFAESHIAGSIFAGPGSQPAGLQLLQSKVASVDKKKLIVLYCGCCPWGRCPNVGPAYKYLHDQGFTNVKVLYLANNFGDDWVAKGYQVEHGQ